jgi:hypothetical protein
MGGDATVRFVCGFALTMKISKSLWKFRVFSVLLLVRRRSDKFVGFE